MIPTCIIVLQVSGPIPESPSVPASRDIWLKQHVKIIGVLEHRYGEGMIYSICLSIIQVSPYLGSWAMHSQICTTNCLTPTNLALPVAPRKAKEKQAVTKYSEHTPQDNKEEPDLGGSGEIPAQV